MFAAGYGAVSDIEVLWTVIASVGLLFSLVTAGYALGDYRHLQKRKIKNGRMILSKAAIITEFGRAYLQAVFLFVGGIALINPEPPSRALSTRDFVLQSIARWGFITGAAVVAGKSIYAWYARKKFLEDVDKDV